LFFVWRGAVFLRVSVLRRFWFTFFMRGLVVCFFCCFFFLLLAGRPGGSRVSPLNRPEHAAPATPEGVGERLSGWGSRGIRRAVGRGRAASSRKTREQHAHVYAPLDPPTAHNADSRCPRKRLAQAAPGPGESLGTVDRSPSLPCRRHGTTTKAELSSRRRPHKLLLATVGSASIGRATRRARRPAEQHGRRPGLARHREGRGRKRPSCPNCSAHRADRSRESLKRRAGKSAEVLAVTGAGEPPVGVQVGRLTTVTMLKRVGQAQPIRSGSTAAGASTAAARRRPAALGSQGSSRCGPRVEATSLRKTELASARCVLARPRTCMGSLARGSTSSGLHALADDAASSCRGLSAIPNPVRAAPNLPESRQTQSPQRMRCTCTVSSGLIRRSAFVSRPDSHSLPEIAARSDAARSEQPDRHRLMTPRALATSSGGTLATSRSGPRSTEVAPPTSRKSCTPRSRIEK